MEASSNNSIFKTTTIIETIIIIVGILFVLSKKLKIKKHACICKVKRNEKIYNSSLIENTQLDLPKINTDYKEVEYKVAGVTPVVKNDEIKKSDE